MNSKLLDQLRMYGMRSIDPKVTPESMNTAAQKLLNEIRTKRVAAELQNQQQSIYQELIRQREIGPGAHAWFPEQLRQPAYRADPPKYHISALAKEKADAARQRVATALPFSVADVIASISFAPDGAKASMRTFQVQFRNGRCIEFTNIESFPTEADIVRICLEAP